MNEPRQANSFRMAHNAQGPPTSESAVGFPTRARQENRTDGDICRGADGHTWAGGSCIYLWLEVYLVRSTRTNLFVWLISYYAWLCSAELFSLICRTGGRKTRLAKLNPCSRCVRIITPTMFPCSSLIKAVQKAFHK